jgi:peptidoglycan/xylan/chitin deacetylase (PgdA/CDA1 family)
MYHRVAPEASGPLAHLTVSPEQFAWQMERLSGDGFVALRQDDVAAWLTGRRELPRRAVVVTFDDGYTDNAVHAFPVLERLRIPAVTFIVTGKLGGCNDWDDGGTWPLMDAASIRDWARRGLEFGAHSRRHRSLIALDERDLGDEIDGSRADLAELLGQAPVAFAYPYGHVDRRVRDKAAGSFALAYGTHEGANRAGADGWSLQRTGVLPAYPRYEFLCQLRLGWGPRHRAHHAAQRVRSWLRAA